MREDRGVNYIKNVFIIRRRTNEVEGHGDDTRAREYIVCGFHPPYYYTIIDTSCVNK